MKVFTSRKRLWTAALALLALSTTGAPAATYGAVKVPDTIRVALFLDLGASKYQSTTPVTTLVSGGSISMSWTGAASGKIDYPATGGTVRFAVDGYRAMLVETSDFAAASAVLKKVQASSKAGFLTKLNKKGKAVYQVTEGVYASAALAKSALSKWTSSGAAAGIPSLTEAFVAGPLAVEAGPYASLASAQAAADQFGNAGLDAFVATKLSAGSTIYVVRVGQASDQSGLSNVQQAAATTGIAVQPATAGSAYAIIRNDATYSGSATATIPLYALPAGVTNASLTASATSGSGVLQVIERSNRSYRGNMEISVLNNNLAVVNVVGLEPYLYSVVGAEIGSSWPLEAQKAQAVAARSYALASGTTYQIADVVDSTYSQAYNGTSSENVNSTAGVDATAGEVLTYNGKVITAMFGASAGGITADPVEYSGNDTPYLAGAVQSPDEGLQKGKLDWYRVALPSGLIGYIRSDLVTDQGEKNEAGVKVLNVTGNGVAVRPSPQIQTGVNPLATVNAGTQVLPLDKVMEYTNYSWVEGPLTADKLLTSINSKLADKSKIQGSLQTLEVSETGASGRAVRLKANGNVIALYGDNWRSALGGIKSTLFTIEETGRFSVLGGNGEQREMPTQSGTLQVLGGDGASVSAVSGNLFVLNGAGAVRAVTTTPQFIISGKGYGHGLGMSQWGARGLAEQGYGYESILKYYYKNVVLEKDG